MADDLRISLDDLRRRMEAGEDFTVIDTRKPQDWRNRMSCCRKPPVSRSTTSKSIFDGFRGINRSSLIAPDLKSIQAPVWRKDFVSADTRMSGHFEVDWMGGKMPDYPRNRNGKRHERAFWRKLR